MSTTDTPPPTDSGPRISGDEARDLGRLRRTTKASPEGRHIAGVGGGLARHFDVDPVIVRVALVVLVFFGGAGLLLYGAGWLFVPEEGSDHATVQLDDRNRSLALYVAAALAALALLGDTIGRFDFPWPVAIIALIVLVVLSKRDRFRLAQRPPEQGPAQPPVGADGTVTYDAPIGPLPYDAATAPVGPPPATVPAYVPVPNPRRRGPILFWFTLALIVLAEGTLAIIDAAGASVADPAYPALAVGITGAMLVLGAFWGRAGGLILIGLIATTALAGSVAAQEYDGNDHRIHATPHTAADVQDSYHLDAGELVVDLTEVSDPAAMDGRTIVLKGGVGKVTLVVPDDWGVGVTARAGVGNVKVLDTGENGGFGIDYSAHHTGSAGAPDIEVNAHVGIGAVEVLDETDYQPWRN
ncbi:PspC domain-containing protein [Nocardioides panacihumi]|uniref:PspC domain-containing protein n=1 Tax=Nocardioides panacihumi TaxID=400774 RepID=A0ABP5CNF7_9ACTN